MECTLLIFQNVRFAVFYALIWGQAVRNVRINVGAGGKESIVNHLMMNSSTLHAGFVGCVLLLVPRLWKLYKKFILA